MLEMILESGVCGRLNCDLVPNGFAALGLYRERWRPLWRTPEISDAELTPEIVSPTGY